MLDYFFPDMWLRNTTEKEKLEHPDADMQQLRRTIRQFKLINMMFNASIRLVREHFFTIMEQDPDLGSVAGRRPEVYQYTAHGNIHE